MEQLLSWSLGPSSCMRQFCTVSVTLAIAWWTDVLIWWHHHNGGLEVGSEPLRVDKLYDSPSMQKASGSPNVPYYLSNFLTILNRVLQNAHNSSLFSEVRSFLIKHVTRCVSVLVPVSAQQGPHLVQLCNIHFYVCCLFLFIANFKAMWFIMVLS